MPKLERLDWIAPLTEGRGVTLSDDPAANQFLAENAGALILGVLYDSQYLTVKAFAVPLRLKERLGHLSMVLLADEDDSAVREAFRQKPALHRFPNKFAQLTQRLAAHIVAKYDGDASRLWTEAADVQELSDRLMEMPAFGLEKTNWTIGMLGRLGFLSFEGWEDFRLEPAKRGKIASAGKVG